jgi:hypothetical protein
MTTYHVRLELVRWVRHRPSGGFQGQYTDLEFPFGKDTSNPYKNYKEAYAAAEKYWKQYEKDLSRVCISRLSHLGNGLGRIVHDAEIIFNEPFEFPAPVHPTRN